MAQSTVEPHHKVYEHDGMLWKPLPGCDSTFEELIHAQRRWMQIFEETCWNPWRTDELTPQADHARQVMREWTRAEPNHRPMTTRQIGAMQAGITRKHQREHKADEARWARDKDRYDSQREHARFALLELEVSHARQARELSEHQSGTIYPSMPADRRRAAIAELEDRLERGEQEIARLAVVVGDREDVVDEEGKLPRDRRLSNLIWYSIRRRDEVEALQQSTTQLRDKLKQTKDRQEKSRLHSRLWIDDRRLQALLAVPILSAEDMCAECCTPQFQHTRSDTDETLPCQRWPLFAARMERVRAILRSASERAHPTAPEPHKPEPLATLPGDLPITEVIGRLSELQTKHPDAVVKRGRANRWELWPKDS